MAVCLAIVGVLVLAVTIYHELSSKKSLCVRAQTDLVHFRDQISLHRTRNPSVSILALSQVLEEGETGEDPWGRQYILEPGSRLICVGPNGHIDILGEKLPDDMMEVIAPNPSEETPCPNVDRAPPIINPVGPIGLIRISRPEFFAKFKDAHSEILTTSGKLLLDGSPVNAKASETEIRFTPKSDLTAGMHLITVKISDVAGNEAMRQWNIEIIPPHCK